MSDTFEFEDEAKVYRLVGTLHDPAATAGDVLTVNADKSISAKPGGGSQPIQATYSGNAVSIADTTTSNLTWDTLAGGTALLDLTVPGNPTFLAAGTYALTVFAQSSAPLTANGFAALHLSTTVLNADYWLGASGHTDFGISGACVFVVGPGDALSAAISNSDGAASRDFSINLATLVKIA